MRKVNTAAVLTALALVLLGADDAPILPKSLAAVTAMHKADTAVESARHAYADAVAKARKSEVVELQAAGRAAAQHEDADEIVAIAAKVKAVEKEAAEVRPDDSTGIVLVSASYGPQSAAVDVTKGVRERLAAHQDLWVDNNIADGRATADGDLTIVIRVGTRELTLIGRHGSRLSIPTK